MRSKPASRFRRCFPRRARSETGSSCCIYPRATEDGAEEVILRSLQVLNFHTRERIRGDVVVKSVSILLC